MKCLLKYQWVKLPRASLPTGKGILGSWARLAARVAFRKGEAHYCGYTNMVEPGTWAGGIVGIKSILGLKNREKAFQTLNILQELGYIQYTLDPVTKKLEYSMKDWVLRCSGAECMNGSVYTTDGYGFLCLPRSIPDRLAKQGYIFEEADAWMDIWCHTVWQDPRNIFSFLAPVIQYGSYGAALTLENLGQRWGWEKTKVWRFFQKHGDVFTLYRLPSSCGCLVFNKLYPTGTEVSMPEYAEIERIIAKMRIMVGNTRISETEHIRLNKMILWYSRTLTSHMGACPENTEEEKRVAVLPPILRVYLSQCWNCKNCEKDCRGIDTVLSVFRNSIRGPCALNFDKAKENHYEQTGTERRQSAL